MMSAPGGATADRVPNDRAPKALDGVGIEEKLGAQVPLQLKLTDAEGHSTSLGQIFAARRPVLMSLNYSSCPMLCSLQLDGLVGGLKDMGEAVGKQYDVVILSIDKNEDEGRLKAFKQKYLRGLRP